MKPLIFLCVVTGAALVYLMSEASSNTELFAQNYPLLLGLGGGLSLGLMALIVYQLSSCCRKLKERVFGSKLTLRLMVVFALMALIPGGLVYAISFQFLQRSIESWFDVRVDKSLEGGPEPRARRARELAQGARPEGRRDVARARDARRRWRRRRSTGCASSTRVEEATLLTPRGKVIAQSSSEPVALLPGPSQRRTCCARCARSRRSARSSRFPSAASTCA